MKMQHDCGFVGGRNYLGVMTLLSTCTEYVEGFAVGKHYDTEKYSMKGTFPLNSFSFL